MELGSEVWRCCNEQLLRGSELSALHTCPVFCGDSSTGRDPGKSGKSLLNVSQCVKARSVLSHPPVDSDGQQIALPCSTTSPAPLTPPFQAQQTVGFSSPSARLLPVLGQDFLKVITSSHELAAGGRAVPMLCQPLPKLLPGPAHPCSEACLHQLGFPVLSHPILKHHFGGPHPAQPLNWC